MLSWFRGARRYFFAIALVFISLWVTSCTQLSATSKQVSTSRSSTVIEFMPRQAVLATVVDAANWSAWRQSSLGPKISQVLTALLDPLNINFVEDIRPWLGDQVAFAVTDIDLDRDRHNGRQVGYLLVTEVADSERLREFLGLFWQRQSVAGAQLNFAEANGVSIITGPVGQTPRQLSTAIVGEKTLLIANDLKALRQSLRVAQSPPLQMSNPDCCAPLWISLQIPSLVNWLGGALPVKPQFMDIRQWQQLKAAVILSSQGILINTQLIAAGGSKALDDPRAVEGTHQQSNIQQYLPNSLAWVALGHDLSTPWGTLQAELSNYQKLPSFLQRVQHWPVTDIGAKFADPLRQLLANGYGVGQFNNGSWVMITPAAEPTVVSQLDKIASETGLTVSQLTLNGHTVTAWSQLKTQLSQDPRNRETTVETDLVVLRTKVDDCEVFATSLSSLTTVLEAPEQSLASSQRFQNATQAMDTASQEYIYGTWNEMERLLASNRWFSLVQPIVQPWGQLIDAIAFTSYGNTSHQSTGTVSVLLKK